MRDDISDIAAYYNSDPDRETGRLERHQIEFDLTWRYLERYLPRQGTILEVGAASGRYTLELARKGYSVIAVDLSAELLAECKKNLAAAGLEGQVRCLVADARDLGSVTRATFDAVLLMGPLYHLIFETDRRAALKEAYDRLRVGGVLFSAFLSRVGVLGDLLKNNPAWIEDQEEVRSLRKNGRRPDEYPRGGFRGYFAEISEVAPLHEESGFETIVLAGLEPLVSVDDGSYNDLQGEQRRLWLDLLFEMSVERSIIAASRHLLYIGRKRGQAGVIRRAVRTRGRR